MKLSRKVFAALLLLGLVLVLTVVPVLAQGTEPPIELPPITVSSLALNVAGLLALMLDYFPGLAAWYDKQSVADKRKIAVVIAVVIVGLVLGGTCAKIFSSNLVCTTSGVWNVVTNIVMAFVVGQGVHSGTKPTPEFKRRVILKLPPSPIG